MTAFLFVVALSTLPFFLLAIMFFYVLYWKIRNFLGDHVHPIFWSKTKRQLMYAFDNLDYDFISTCFDLREKGIEPPILNPHYDESAP